MIDLTLKPKPRGDVRILYTTDTYAIAWYILTSDPDETASHDRQGGTAHSGPELRRHLDELAANGVDLFAQCIFSKQGVGWFQPEHPDHEHQPSGMDRIDGRDGPAIEVAIDQCHRRGMKFLAKFRMADRHGLGDGPGMVPRGLLGRRSDLWNPDFGDGAMDYTHAETRDWVFAMIEEILCRFDVDGFEFNYIRWMHCFPRATARQSHTIMTDFVRRVRERLDVEAAKKGRDLWLGVRVPQTLAECTALGYDVPTWIREGLIDYVAPCDFFFSDFNAKYEEFGSLTRGSDCLLLPAVHPVLTWEDQSRLMRPEHYRAVVQNMYAASADGVSIFNPMYHWVRREGTQARYPGPPSGYPTALAWLRQMRSPERYASLPRHYLFQPLWPIDCPSPSGFAKHDRIVLERKAGNDGAYRFRIAEDLSQPGFIAELIVTVSESARGDRFEFMINGSPVDPDSIKHAWNREGRLEKYGRPLDPCWTFMFRLASPPAVFGDNTLGVRVVTLDEEAEDDIVIDELEVTVLPPMEH